MAQELGEEGLRMFEMWPTAKTLGRHSISPDNVAQLAWNNVPLELIMFYHDGQLVEEAVQVEKMRELMTQ